MISMTQFGSPGVPLGASAGDGRSNAPVTTVAYCAEGFILVSTVLSYALFHAQKIVFVRN